MKNFKIYKVFVAIIFVIATIFCSIMLGQIINDEKNAGTAFALIAWFALAIPTYAVSIITSLIGAISSLIKRKQGLCDSKTVIYFVIFTLLPIIAFIGSIIACNVML